MSFLIKYLNLSLGKADIQDGKPHIILLVKSQILRMIRKITKWFSNY